MYICHTSLSFVLLLLIQIISVVNVNFPEYLCLIKFHAGHPKYWISLVWAGAVVTRAKKEGKIKDEFAFQTIIKEINDFRSNCGGLLAYDWIPIPLVYTQVIVIPMFCWILLTRQGTLFNSLMFRL